VLATVDHHGARLTTLVERGGRTKQATAELAGHLTARGYLELHPDPSDGRAKLYLPTARGYQLLASCEIVVDAYEKWLNGVLGESGVAQLRHALTEIVNHDA
jgi:DNA-binding MarR family transcriptional regulator